ncbi:MAG: YbaB/EbfC family nucleoid-associated protein [Sulfurospirillum sp.]|nr:MAG: YbaB/EbfC family nucleoid-associated protein [Sulfurospirillum sp.]
MFEGMDMKNLEQMLQKAQESAKKLQEESKNKTFTSKSGGGMVKVSANGNGEIIDLEIDDSLLEDKDSMQILLISAINDVMKMVEDDKKMFASKMMGSFGGFGV